MASCIVRPPQGHATGRPLAGQSRGAAAAGQPVGLGQGCGGGRLWMQMVWSICGVCVRRGVRVPAPLCVCSFLPSFLPALRRRAACGGRREAKAGRGRPTAEQRTQGKGTGQGGTRRRRRHSAGVRPFLSFRVCLPVCCLLRCAALSSGLPSVGGRQLRRAFATDRRPTGRRVSPTLNLRKHTDGQLTKHTTGRNRAKQRSSSP
jgi:hypothetical protein